MTATADQRGAPRKVLVVGLGNPDRGDDGIGTIVVQQLAGRLPADVALLARSGDMLALIADWAGFDALVCVDAAGPMMGPGRIHRIDLAIDALPPNISITSSHAFSLAEAVSLARTLQLAPQDIVVYAVEGCCFDSGAPLTAAVMMAAGEVARRILVEVGHLRRRAIETTSHA